MLKHIKIIVSFLKLNAADVLLLTVYFLFEIQNERKSLKYIGKENSVLR